MRTEMVCICVGTFVESFGEAPRQVLEIDKRLRIPPERVARSRVSDKEMAAMNGLKQYRIRHVLSPHVFSVLRRTEGSPTAQPTLSSSELRILGHHYALTNEQLWHVVQRAVRLYPLHWSSGLIGLLERRLDNVVHRLGFAWSIPGARQLISHGRILVNGRLQTDCSTVLRPGEIICVSHPKPTPFPTEQIQLPSYLQFLNPRTWDRAIVLSIPDAGHLPSELRRMLSS